jgi:hypothetical protein
VGKIERNWVVECGMWNKRTCGIRELMEKYGKTRVLKIIYV